MMSPEAKPAPSRTVQDSWQWPWAPGRILSALFGEIMAEQSWGSDSKELLPLTHPPYSAPHPKCHSPPLSLPSGLLPPPPQDPERKMKDKQEERPQDKGTGLPRLHSLSMALGDTIPKLPGQAPGLGDTPARSSQITVGLTPATQVTGEGGVDTHYASQIPGPRPSCGKIVLKKPSFSNKTGGRPPLQEVPTCPQPPRVLGQGVWVPGF